MRGGGGTGEAGKAGEFACSCGVVSEWVRRVRRVKVSREEKNQFCSLKIRRLLTFTHEV